MANILEVKGGVVGTMVPTTSWSAPNGMFGATDRNDGSIYGWADSTSTITLPASALADGYLFLWGYESEDTTNGRCNPQGRMAQASGTGNFITATTGGYCRDTSEDRSYVSGWSFVDSPSASATFQFQFKRDTDAPDVGDGMVRSFIQCIPFFYADIGLYSSTSTQVLGGTTPLQVTGFTGTDGTNVTISSNAVSVTGDNKRYLALGSGFMEGTGGSRTQRWFGLEIDGVFDHAAKGCAMLRNDANDESGESFMRMIETITATRTIEMNGYRGIGVAAGEGGADTDGTDTPTAGAYSMVVIELNDDAEVFSSVDSVGAQEFALTGPVDVDIASTGDIEFSDAASFVRATDIAVNCEVAMDVLAFANVSHARETGSFGSGSRWTVHGEFTIDGVEVTDAGFHGNYNRGNQSTIDCHGSSCNQAGVFAMSADEDIGVSNTELSGTEGGNGDIETQPGWVGFGLINIDTLEASAASNDIAAAPVITASMASDLDATGALAVTHNLAMSIAAAITNANEVLGDAYPIRRVLRTQPPPAEARIDWTNPLTHGLVACWAGDQIIDRVLGGQLTPVSDANFGNHLHGPTLEMDNTAQADYFLFADQPRLDITGELTLISLMRNDIQTDTSNHGLLTKYHTTGDQRSYALVLDFATSNSNPKPTFAISSSGTFGTTIELSAVSNADAGEWHLVGGSYKPSTHMKIFVDGVQEAIETSAIASSIFSGTAALWIGMISTANDQDGHQGGVALSLIYDRDLSDEEHAELAANPWQIFEPRREPLMILTPEPATMSVYPLRTQEHRISLSSRLIPHNVVGESKGVQWDNDPQFDSAHPGGASSAVWIFLTAVEAVDQSILIADQIASDADDGGVGLFLNASGEMEYRVIRATSDQAGKGFPGDQARIVGRWAHLAGAWNGGGTVTGNRPQVYIDGVNVNNAGGNGSGALVVAPGSHSVGGRESTQNRGAGGYLAAPARWNHCLTADEIRSLYEGTHPLDMHPDKLLLCPDMETGENHAPRYTGSPTPNLWEWSDELGPTPPNLRKPTRRLPLLFEDAAATSDIAAAITKTLSLAADLDATGAVAAALATSMAVASDLDAVGSIAAAVSIALSVASDLNAAGELAAANVLTLGIAADLDAAGELSAAQTISLAMTSDLDATGKLEASTNLLLSVVADVDGAADNELASVLDTSLTVAADLDAAGKLEASQSIALGVAADIDALGKVEAAALIVLSIASDLKGSGDLASSNALQMSVLADLDSLGVLSVAASLALLVAVELDATGKIEAAATLTMAVASDLTAQGKLEAAENIAISMASDLVSASSNDLATAINVALTASPDLNATGTLAAASSLALSAAMDLSAQGKIEAANALILQLAADMNAAGTLSTVAALVLTTAANLTAAGEIAEAFAISVTLAASMEDGGSAFVAAWATNTNTLMGGGS